MFDWFMTLVCPTPNHSSSRIFLFCYENSVGFNDRLIASACFIRLNRPKYTCIDYIYAAFMSKHSHSIKTLFFYSIRWGHLVMEYLHFDLKKDAIHFRWDWKCCDYKLERSVQIGNDIKIFAYSSSSPPSFISLCSCNTHQNKVLNCSSAVLFVNISNKRHTNFRAFSQLLPRVYFIQTHTAYILSVFSLFAIFPDLLFRWIGGRM